MSEEVGSLRVGLALDSATFDQSLKSVDRNLKALGGEMGIIRAKGNEWGLGSFFYENVPFKTFSSFLE